MNRVMICKSQQSRLAVKRNCSLEVVLSLELIPRLIQSPKNSTRDHTLLSRGSGRDLDTTL